MIVFSTFKRNKKWQENVAFSMLLSLQVLVAQGLFEPTDLGRKKREKGENLERKKALNINALRCVLWILERTHLSSAVDQTKRRR